MSLCTGIDKIVASHIVEGDDAATIRNLSSALAACELASRERMARFFEGEHKRVSERLAAFELCAQKWHTAQAMTKNLLASSRRDPRLSDEDLAERLQQIADYAGPAPVKVSPA